MDIGNYSEAGVELALDLVNTQAMTRDRLPDLTATRAFLDGHGIAGPVGEADLPRLQRLRERLRAVFEAGGDADRAAAILTELLVEHRAVPRLVAAEGVLRLEAGTAHDDAVDAVGSVAAMALAVLLAEVGAARLGTCHSQTCQDAYVDLTKNRSKRFCGDGCARITGVRNFRSRRRAHEAAQHEDVLTSREIG